MPKKVKILIADSDLDLLSKLYLTLLHKGYRIEATNEPEEIIMRMERFKPNLLILNDMMDGLTKTILFELYKKKTAVLLITEAKDPYSEFRFRKMEHLHKPVDMIQLDIKIKELINIIA
jgi:Response regulator containing CheY-like receiver, AAA-type ATPase, and DNA-binding domains